MLISIKVSEKRCHVDYTSSTPLVASWSSPGKRIERVRDRQRLFGLNLVVIAYKG